MDIVLFGVETLERIQWQVKQLTWRLDQFFAQQRDSSCVNPVEHRGLIYEEMCTADCGCAGAQRSDRCVFIPQCSRCKEWLTDYMASDGVDSPFLFGHGTLED